jgi:acyl-CoA reductase-like NAD-dependent aldehyde dehydrogenase
VPWNYPFHNVFNPLVAALYAGNGIVIKVTVVSSQLAEYPASQGSAALVSLLATFACLRHGRCTAAEVV